jgi:acyl carrier protein
MDHLKEEVKNFIFKTFPLAKKHEIEAEDSLLESGIVDSLAVIEIVNFLVEKHQVTIDEDDLTPENFNSILSIAELIIKKRDGHSK